MSGQTKPQQVPIYNCSTFSLVQGVFRKNFKLDFTLGSFVKLLILTQRPISSQPIVLTKVSTMVTKVIPCNGLFFEL